MKSPFLTTAELKKITGTDTAKDQIEVLRSYGLHPVAPRGKPVIYRDVVMKMMMASDNDDVEIDFGAINAKS